MNKQPILKKNLTVKHDGTKPLIKQAGTQLKINKKYGTGIGFVTNMSKKAPESKNKTFSNHQEHMNGLNGNVNGCKTPKLCVVPSIKNSGGMSYGKKSSISHKMEDVNINKLFSLESMSPAKKDDRQTERNSENFSKIKEIIGKMSNLVKKNLSNLDKMVINSENKNNVNSSCLEKHNGLKISLINYEIEIIHQDAKEFYEESIMKKLLQKPFQYCSEDLSGILNKNYMKSSNENHSIDFSEERISHYKKCFDLCSTSLQDIILMTPNNKSSENSEHNNYITNSNNNFTFNLNLNLNVMKALGKDTENIKSKYESNSNLACNTKLASYLKQSVKSVKQRENTNDTYIDYTTNTSNINENVKINLPYSHIKYVNKPNDAIGKIKSDSDICKKLKLDFNLLSLHKSAYRHTEIENENSDFDLDKTLTFDQNNASCICTTAPPIAEVRSRVRPVKFYAYTFSSRVKKK